ncbi:MAG: DUF2828 family protein [Lachnospiraceae bacterium]|nr:DUF2828 family protein [Lachnospiraceae bacterium]
MNRENKTVAENPATESTHGRFLQALTKETARLNNLMSTENGLAPQPKTGSALLDFNARANALRYSDKAQTEEAAAKTYSEDALLAVKLFFLTGDIRGGKGERDVFNACMDFLVSKHPVVAVELLPLIPVYTRWDYLIRLTLAENEKIAAEATRLVTEQFQDDLKIVREGIKGTDISLLAKWMPSLQTKKAEDKPKVRHLLKALHMQERDYRHALSELRDRLSTAGQPQKPMFYSAYLKRVIAEKRHTYLKSVLRGESKLSPSALNPLSICHNYLEDALDDGFAINEDFEALWSILPAPDSGNGKLLVVRDGSDSMTRSIGKETSANMLETATALSVYCGEKLPGAFHDKFITFSEQPQLVDMSACESLCDRLKLCYKYDERATIDVAATYDLLLDTAVSEHLKQDDLPSSLMIISDMEFDVARGADWDEDHVVGRKTLFEKILKKWKEAGYEMPKLVYWNLNGKCSLRAETENDAVYLTGFSAEELTKILSEDFSQVSEPVAAEALISPKDQLIAKLSQSRYDAVEEAVKRAFR